MEWMTIVALCLSGLSIIVSVVAFIKSHRTQQRLLQIEETREHDRQDKARRASLTTKFEHIQQQGYYALHIENQGASEARNVTVKLDRKSISELRNISPSIPNIPTIGPMSSASYNWPTANNPTLPLILEITWSDDSGKLGRYCTTLVHPTKPS